MAIISPVTPLLPLLLGGLAIAAGLGLLRTLGPRLRVGRLLGAAPEVSIAEAVELAVSGRRRWVLVRGRIDSEEEFEDPDHRPLVLRRRRLEARAGSGWRTASNDLEVVGFVVREGLDELAVDGRALDAGLVVLPRVSQGTAGELRAAWPKLVEPGRDPATPVRIVVEQVSSVEHAIVGGVPRLDDDGRPTIGPGLGRPLVLTTLEKDEAMRVIAGGRSMRVRLAALAMSLGLLLIMAAIAWFAAASLVEAASPSPSPGTGSDTRSPGQGPGLVGDPGLALGAVAGIAILATLLTLAYVRLTRQPYRRPPRG